MCQPTVGHKGQNFLLFRVNKVRHAGNSVP